jgi:hypothetical protein
VKEGGVAVLASSSRRSIPHTRRSGKTTTTRARYVIRSSMRRGRICIPGHSYRRKTRVPRGLRPPPAHPCVRSAGTSDNSGSGGGLPSAAPVSVFRCRIINAHNEVANKKTKRILHASYR